MKRIILLLILNVVFIMFSTSIYFFNVDIFKNNIYLYDYFKEEGVVGVDGEINLSGIEKEKDVVYNELLGLFQFSDYDYDIYLKEIEDRKNKNVSLKKEIDSLMDDVSELEAKKNSFSSEYNVLYKKYQSMGNDNNNTVSVNKNNSYNFPLINQYPRYKTGCESVALTMLLQYYDVNVTPDMVISRLKKGSLPYWENGKMYGGNPEVEFVGNPYSNASYGVYERPIADVANMFKSGIVVRKNFSFDNVVNLVENGTPVMVWTSMGLALPYISTSWIYKPTMETIDWHANEHVVVVVGVSATNVVVADPMGGRLKTYSRSLFEQRYNYFGKRALYY